jgi:D-alanine transfer protein
LASPAVAWQARSRALQVEAFRRGDLLPVYGTSEVLNADPYHADALFRSHPTGFLPFPVGLLGGCALLHAEKLAAVGTDLRGKKVVISVTPGPFMRPAVPEKAYAAYFSSLDANEVAFSTALSLATKTAAARRMLQFPRTLEQDPLLRFALEQIADGSPRGVALYYAALPLGKLNLGVLRLRDHRDSVTLIRKFAPPLDQPDTTAARLPPDWPALANRAAEDCRKHADNNPFGFDNHVWMQTFAGGVPRYWVPLDDDEFLRWLKRSEEWDDLSLLLRTLRELGAEPLLVSTPLNGPYYDYAGVSARARTAYYARLREVARAQDVPVVDFAEHDEDPGFLVDLCHLSSKGWIYYARVLDTFYHTPRASAFSGGPAGALLLERPPNRLFQD